MEEYKVKKKILVKLIALLCSLSATFSATSLVVSANPKKTSEKNPSISSSIGQNANEDQKQVEDLIRDLMLSYDVENIGEEPTNAANIVSQLAKKENFYGQEEKIIKAIAFVFQKDYFENMSENTAVEIKNILQRCANNQTANKYMAYAMGYLLRNKASVAFANNEQDKQKIKEILKNCASGEETKEYVTWAISGSFDQYYKDDFEGALKLLKTCSTNKEALPDISCYMDSLLEKNKDINPKDLYDILNILNLCASEFSSVSRVKALNNLLKNQHFCDLLKDHSDVKTTVVNILKQCYKLSLCHDIIQQILTENPFNLFDQESINAIISVPIETRHDLSRFGHSFNISFDQPRITSEIINKNIIDIDSHNKKDEARNKIRESINSDISKYNLYEYGGLSLDSIPLRTTQYKLNIIRNIIKSKVKNKFDQFMYKKIARSTINVIRGWIWIFKYHEDVALKHKEKSNQGFNFPLTKMTLSNRFIEQERDLIKKFLLKIVFQDMEYCEPIEFTTQYIYDPYDCKKATEEFYFECLKKYHDNDNIEYDINANDLEIRSQANTIALKDAQDQTKTNLSGKSEVFKKTYCETLALANAEIDAKLCKKRQHKAMDDENMQKFYEEQYDNQYNEVVKQIGDHDGQIINSRKIFENDPIAQKNYDQGYLNGVRKQAKKDIIGMDFNCEKYQWQESRGVYLQAFEDAVYKRAVDYSAIGPSPKLELNDDDWQEFLMDCNDDTIEIIEFKKRVKQRYIEGFREGFRKRGLNYANADQKTKEKYKFDTISKSDLGEFYDDFKKAYEQGLKEGLKEVELQKAKK